MERQFYTYVWLRENGIPKYVGKGSGDRAYEQQGHRIKMPPKEAITVYLCPDEATALAYERYLIDFRGRIDNGTGCLANLTDGGENPPSWRGKKRTHSEDSKKKMSESQKGNKSSVGRVLSDKTKKKISEALVGQKLSEETKRKISKAVKGSKNGFFGKHHSEEARKAVAESNRRRIGETKPPLSESHKRSLRLARTSTIMPEE